MVIAIISVLAGLLLPALENALAAARHASCIGNLKQHGIAHATYSNDYEGVFPLFGGKVGYQGTRYVEEAHVSGAPMPCLFAHNTGSATAARVYLPEYLEATLEADACEARAIAYCPSYDWDDPQVPTYKCEFLFNSQHNHLLQRGQVGYAFHTGRKNWDTANWSHWRNAYVDTRQRRDDPGEILVSDVLMENRHWNHCGMSDPGRVYNWFNPHSGGTNTAAPEDSAHQVLADGAVISFLFEDANCVGRWAAGQHYNYAYGEQKGGEPGENDGTYYANR